MKVVNEKLSFNEANKIFKDISEVYLKMGDPTYLNYMSKMTSKFVFQNIIGTVFYRFVLECTKVLDKNNSVIAYCFHRKIGKNTVICMDIYIPSKFRGKGLSKEVLTIYRKELFKQGYLFILGAAFNKNIASQKMLKNYADSHFFFNNAIKYHQNELSEISCTKNFNFKKTKNSSDAFIALTLENIKEDFLGTNANETVLKDVIKFIWGPFIYEIYDDTTSVGFFTYETLNGSIHMKIALKDNCWSNLPEIIKQCFQHFRLKEEEIIVQYPNHIQLHHKDVTVKYN